MRIDISSNSCWILLFKVPLDSSCCLLSNKYGVGYVNSKRQRGIMSVYPEVFNGVLLPNCFSWVRSTFRVASGTVPLFENSSCGALAHPAFEWVSACFQSAFKTVFELLFELQFGLTVLVKKQQSTSHGLFEDDIQMAATFDRLILISCNLDSG